MSAHLPRRTFAIISHPDAGKTTLTEKFLLYGGAVALAGSVTARKDQRATASDWMELEKQRGISISSTVLQFDYNGYRVNLLDTPGHKDFSEDTYRVLTAVDAAVMVIDAGKGIEPQTRKLFEVCRRRGVPIFTFMNKCDRPTKDPIALLDELESVLGIGAFPVNWPFGNGPEFRGVYDRLEKRLHLFERTKGGMREAPVQVLGLDDPAITSRIDDDIYRQGRDELEMLEGAGAGFDRARVLAGEITPVYFGSAANNFGVQLLLDGFLEHSADPGPRVSGERIIEPKDPEFSGFVFKIQANMDPKHRDRVAFVRIVSGHFEANMQVLHQRSGKPIRLAAPQQFMARDRVSIEEAWPGDVIGIMDRGNLRIGDTLGGDGTLEFQGIPRFPPEHFARAIPADPLKRKQFDSGLRQLTEEGAAQVFFAETSAGSQPIVGAVGQLQFDVMAFRLEHEYAAPCKFEKMTYRWPRWITGPKADVERVATGQGRLKLFDHKGHVVVLFSDAWALRRALQHETSVVFHETAP